MKTTEKVLRVIDRVNINQRTYERHNSSFIYNEIDKKKKIFYFIRKMKNSLFNLNEKKKKNLHTKKAMKTF